MITVEEVLKLQDGFKLHISDQHGHYACSVWFSLISSASRERICVCLSARFDDDVYNLPTLMHHPSAMEFDLAALISTSVIERVVTDAAIRWHDQICSVFVRLREASVATPQQPSEETRQIIRKTVSEHADEFKFVGAAVSGNFDQEWRMRRELEARRRSLVDPAEIKINYVNGVPPEDDHV